MKHVQQHNRKKSKNAYNSFDEGQNRNQMMLDKKNRLDDDDNNIIEFGYIYMLYV